MRYTNEMLLMISSFLFGSINARDFHERYEQRFLDIQDELNKENETIEGMLSGIAYECAFFDAYNTKEAHLHDEEAFRIVVADTYSKIIPLATKAKVS